MPPSPPAPATPPAPPAPPDDVVVVVVEPPLLQSAGGNPLLAFLETMEAPARGEECSTDEDQCVWRILTLTLHPIAIP